MDIIIGGMQFTALPDGDYKLTTDNVTIDFGADQMQAMLKELDAAALKQVRIVINGVSFTPEGRD